MDYLWLLEIGNRWSSDFKGHSGGIMGKGFVYVYSMEDGGGNISLFFELIMSNKPYLYGWIIDE